MRGAEIKGKSRRQMRAGSMNKTGKSSHFRTVRFGGFEETQIICYLWDVIKAVEAGTAARAGASDRPDSLAEEARQLRMQMRVEMRRYFARRKRRNVRTVLTFITLVLSVTCLFSFVIGVDRVSGESMYPYLNNGDWIIYSRLGGRFNRDEVVVFENGGENFVKRIVGLPGDTVEISASGSRVVVNGTQVREDYVTLAMPDGGSDISQESKGNDGGQESAGNAISQESAGNNSGQERVGNDDGQGDAWRADQVAEQMGVPMTVMDGQYLVLGDNRSISIDSRDSRMGTVPAEEMRGRVVLVIRKNAN